MKKEILIKRLSIIKLLYHIGYEQSKQSESIAFYSILSFHDSIEMFLKLACELKNIQADKLSFIEYWDKLPNLTLKEEMRAFNARRVNLKHKGLIPAKIEVETCRVNTRDFFEQNTSSIFGVEFSDISLINLIKFEKVEQLVLSADQYLKENDYKSSHLKFAEAFEELLVEYKSNKTRFSNSNLFNFSDRIKTGSGSSSFSRGDEKDRRLDDVVKQINKKFREIEKALEIISLGFDFRKYSKFRLITPEYSKDESNRYIFLIDRKKYEFNKENCDFLFDFVLECCLKLQEFDYENPHMQKYVQNQ